MPSKKTSRSKSGMSMKRSMSGKRSGRSRSRRSAATSHGQQASITGSFQGNIQASGHLHIASGAKCNATVKAQSVQVDGMFKGCMIARNQMKLGSKCQVQGEIVADKLVAADGAAFVGTCRLGKMRKAA